ncbi:hypothetical protein IWW36_003782 [Coemansia brasiliensis]|uniref:N-acetyltransferase domain-containing protein n=1 Tax=Coemansia brasiliensis TaxID=2650707 RepID=A0A9W8LZF2_9FUNG|nr:hypothetical protein IWW36_003782 [Coemansia brasiliensis]
MDRKSLKFAALETAQAVPVVGFKTHINVARYLHSLGTTHAYRVLGGILSSNLLVNGYDHQSTSNVHNEVWMHLNREPDSKESSTSIVQNSRWDIVDFIVLLTVYHDGDFDKGKLEVRVAINSTHYASLDTINRFSKFILALWGLRKDRPMYFKGVEDYLLDSLQGVKFTTRIKCLNYAVDSDIWHRSFNPGSFTESEIAQKLDLHMSQITAEDIDTIQGLNVIKYDKGYLENCCPASSCIRRASDSAPVSWVVCHADYQIGALLTVDDYRSRGLAKFILQDLGNKMIANFAAKMTLLYDEPPTDFNFQLQMITELTNINTRRLFERFGFRPVANVSWAECTFEVAKLPSVSKPKL